MASPLAPVDPAEIVAWIAAIFEAAGCPDEEAGLIGRHLVDADLSGHPSHGIVRVPRYLDWLKTGKMRTPLDITTIVRTGSLALLDGHFSFGQVLGHRVVELAGEMVAEQGVAVIGLRHAGHLGRIGAWAELLAERGLVSIHFVAVPGSRIVAPFGGRDARMSTAPVAIGVPHRGPDGRDEPFILDFATSRVAEGKVLVALKTGKPLPADAIVGPDGGDSDDPRVFYGPSADSPTPDGRKGDAALQAMGEHKGSGLALACELLAGALIGSGTNADDDAPFCNGMLSIVIDPKRLGEEDTILGDIGRFIAFVRAAAPREAGGSVRVPGDPERERRRAIARDGLALDPALRDMLVAASTGVGVAVPPAFAG